MSDAAFDKVHARYLGRITNEAKLAQSLPASELFRRRDEFLLPVGEEVAGLLVKLVVGLDAKTIVELGTSYGFSTLHLAGAAQRTGGRLYTYEIDAAKQAHARRELTEAGVGSCVVWRLGDAVNLLGSQPGPVDFVLMDLWKDLYVPCFEAIAPLLAPGGMIVADNMLFPEMARPDAAAYRAAVRASSNFEAVLLPLGHGIEIARKRDPE